MSKRLARAGVLCIAAIVLLVLLANLALAGWGLPCVVHIVTGAWCPGCGMGRAVGYLLRLDVRAALSYNALGVLCLPLLAVLLGAQALRYVRGTQRKYRKAELYLSIGLAVCFILFGVLRNLPAFAMLAPPL